MNEEKKYPQRYCENSNCPNLIDTDYDLILKDSADKTLRQRYCLSCARNIQEELGRKEWREELGIG